MFKMPCYFVIQITFSVLLFSVGLSKAAASEWVSLQERENLWQQIQQDIDYEAKPALIKADASEVNSLEAKSPELQFILIKASTGKLSFEHYDTLYQGYPVLNGRLVLAKNSQGQLKQILGELAAGLFADLPNAAAGFTQSEQAVRAWLLNQQSVNHSMDGLKLYPAIYIDDGLAKTVYRISYLLHNKEGVSIERPQLIVDARTLQVIKQWDGLDKLLVMAGGAGGNEALGLNCYSPAPGSMAQCLAYVGEDDPVVSEISFQNLRVNNIFSAFSGYPFIVTQNGTNCWLKNDYVTTIKAVRNTPSDTAFQYSCDGSTEHFDKQSIDDNDYDYYSFFPINDAHFYAGIVMQMYDQYLYEIYPDQLADCPENDASFCLKPIKQRANAKGPTGGDIGNANWDGEYVNYGNGDPWAMYSQTTIDIVAHEISHAVTEWNSDPIRGGQSSALDESFSDIAAIAANDFFERHVSGSYASSVPYMNKREYPWRYGWDVFPGGRGGRDFQRPSWDGRGIGDARDYEQGMRGHALGGVTNKLFYELVTRQGWSIEEAFKLMLEANVSCWTPQVEFKDAGTCLLLLTSDINKFRQLDRTLHAVGIFSPQSEINPLPFEITQLDNQLSYKILLPQGVEAESISIIDVDWGDDTLVESWGQESTLPIGNYLEAEHTYNYEGHPLVSITVSLNDGSEWQGYRHIYISADVAPIKDITPDAFVFPAASEVPLAEMVVSPSITITGINAATKIQINKGEYSIDGGDFTADEGLITNDQQVVVRLLSSDVYSESIETILTVGEVSATFVVTALEETIVPDKSSVESGGSGGGAISLFELLLLFSMLGLSGGVLRRVYSLSIRL